MAVIATIAVVIGGVVLGLNYRAAERERQAAEEQERLQTEEADQAAAEFFAALDAHEEIWSEEAVAMTFGAEVASSFDGMVLQAERLTEPAAALAQVCTEQADAVAAFEALEEATRPELARVPGTSDSYRSAQTAATHSRMLAEAEAAYLAEGRDLSTDLLDYCQAWSDGFTTMSAARVEFEEDIDSFLVPEGQSQSEGNWLLECSDADGCLPLVREDREAYADATVAYYTTETEVSTALFTDHCFDGYEDYCAAENAHIDLQLEYVHAAMDLLRGPLGTGSEALPGYNDAVEEWDTEVWQSRREVSDLLVEVDSDLPPGQVMHFSNHQVSVLDAWQRRVAELAHETLQRYEADQV